MLRAVRRTSDLVGAVALTGAGLALGAEVTGVGGSRWRHEVVTTVDTVLWPSWPLWLTTLVGLGVAAGAVILVAAELRRPSRGANIMYPVHSTTTGDTRIAGRAAMAAARRQVTGIEGVVDVDTTLSPSAMTVTVRVDDRADLATVEAEVRDRLGHPFWIDLGLAQLDVNLRINHHPNPPRVR